MPDPAPLANSPPQGSRAPAIRFSTGQFSERDRIPAWREFIGRTFCRVNIEPHSPARFASTATMRMLPGLGIVSGNCSPLSYVQSPDLVENDDVILTVSSRPWQLQRSGREIAFDSGDATVTSAADIGTYRLPLGGRHFGLRVPFALMSPLATDIEDAFGRPIPARTPALQLLIHYLGGIKEISGPDTHVLQRQAATHVHDLLALAVGATRDAAESARRGGQQAAQLRAVKDDIAGMLDQERLSLAALAVRYRCTPRSIQRLFEAEGTTFSEYVVTQRLARAYRILTDPRNADQKISAVAFDVGFGDVSYFHRSFRERYGDSPAAVRAQAAPRPGARAAIPA
jgi:AraC-like DNA-binding protein